MIIAILSLDWAEDPPLAPDEDTIDMTQSQTDYYLESFETRKFDVAGQQTYRFSGDTLSHFPEDDRSVIEAPELIVYRENIVWHMQSPRGVFTPEPDKFLLEGNVSMRRVSNRQLIRLETSDVTVLTDDNQVSTGQPITVSGENWQLRSIGLESDISDGTLKLLSNVTARYETPGSAGQAPPSQ